MKIPRDLYGRVLADHLCKRWDYKQAHQTGSHIILDTDLPTAKRISIPAHKPLKVGTLTGILKEIAEHKEVSRADILRGL